MSIHDRDYVRSQKQGSGLSGGASPGRSALGAVSGWSVTTWLIVLCTLVFAADAFAPHRFWKFVMVQEQFTEQGLQRDPRRFAEVPPAAELDKQAFQRRMSATAIIDTASNERVGERYYLRMPPLTRWLHFSTHRGLGEFWRLIGFQFLHADLTHLVFNMIGLFFFGPIVERYLGGKRFLAFYLLCGIFGALLYLALNLTGYVLNVIWGPGLSIPGLLFDGPHTPLIGASAGVYGVLMAGAYLVPNAVVYLFFILPMRLATLAYVLVAFSLLSLFFGAHNAGGHAAHLGGAIAGFYFIRKPHHLHGFFDILGRADPTSHHYRSGGKRPPSGRGGRSTPPPQPEIDRILAKISASGLHSLSEEEKRTLHDAARE